MRYTAESFDRASVKRRGRSDPGKSCRCAALASAYRTAPEAMTPAARSIRLLEAEGFAVDTVERWIPGAGIRRDLFGMFDLLAIRDSSTLAVQVTTADHVANRRRKLADSPLLARCKAAGWQIELHGWHKSGQRWQCRREPM